MNEQERLAALRALRLMDTLPEPAFDQIVDIAARLFEAPMAGLSLIDDKRQWFKSRVGLESENVPREETICAYALGIDPPGALVVEDASADPRFADNPHVIGPAHVRFYVGAPMIDRSGAALGVLCVVDTVPRARPPMADIARLQNLAAMAVDLIERRQVERLLAEQQRTLNLAEAMSGVGRWRFDPRGGEVTWSDEIYRIYGVERGSFVPSRASLAPFHSPEEQAMIDAAFAKALADCEGFDLSIGVRRPDGQARHVRFRAAAELDDTGRAAALFGVIQDVTDQREALERVRRSQSRYKLLTDHMGDVITRIALDGSSSYISPAIERLIGYTPREMAGRPAQAFVYEPDQPMVMDVFAQMAAGREEVTLEHRAAHRDGHPVWVESRFQLLRDASGRPTEMVTVIRDISQRKTLEAQLRASEARAQKVIADAYQAIITLDEEGRITGWNRYAEVTFGWTASEALGQSLFGLVLPADRVARAAALGHFLRTGEGPAFDQRIEMEARRKEGGVFPVEAAISATEGPEGWQFTLLMHDITERKAQMEVFETAFSHASIGMALVNLAGGFLKINEAFCGIVGYRADEVLDLDFQAITHPEDLNADLAQLERLLAGEISSYAMDKRYIRKDGRPVWVNLSVSLVRAPDGAPRHFIAQVMDLTARVEAQDALEQKTLALAAMAEQLSVARDAAEAANRAKGEFLANMSHELRTPLNGVIGFSRLLAESADLTEQDRHRARLVRGAGEALNALINDVLDFSKLEARAIRLEARPFTLSDMVSEALSMVEPAAAEKGLSLRIAGADPGVLVGDKYRLRQVVLNLLSNAVKFTPHGTVTIRLEATPLGDGHVEVRLEVVDEGVGIAEDNIGALFKRFSQADGTIARTYGGTGLGLAISRELIELMGGRIGVESELGKGSTFWFSVVLPRGEMPAPRERSTRGRAMFPGRRVLVVDDVALNRDLCEAMLSQHGCASDVACDGEEAVRAALTHRYDLILMDVHMPGVDGLEATARIRAEGLDVPIIALSASGAPEQIRACLEVGMNGHLLKPLPPQDLEMTLVRVFDGAAQEEAAAPVETEPDVDDEVQRDFEAMMGAETARFVVQAREQFASLLASDDHAALKADAHRLAGSAGLLGLGRLGQAAGRLEARCDEGRGVEAAAQEAREALAQGLEALSAWQARLEQER